MAGRVPYITTAGELKRALADIPDDMPLAIEGRGLGWGFVPPYVAEYQAAGSFIAAGNPFLKKENRWPTQYPPERLSHPVCALHFSVGLDFQQKYI